MYEQYSEDELALAHELSETLNDPGSLQLYAQFTKKFTSDYLRSVLAKVMAIDGSKIKKTRGALFTYLIKEHGKQIHPRG